MKKKILFVAACITGSALFAQDIKTLNEIIIEVTKFPQKQNETGKVLTVITKEQLQKSMGKSLAEVLNQQVGITISGANNNPGTNQSLYIRGGHAANTLILVDGVPVYDASGETSQFDISNFSLYNIERIEILKGAQSTLYGSDAVAGVINIITKKSGDKPFGFNGIFSAGSYNTFKGSLSINGNQKGQTYFISWSKINSRGFSAAYDSTGKDNFDKDAFNQDAIQANYGFKFLKKLEARVYGNYNINKADIDAGAFADDKDYFYKYHNLQTGSYLKYTLSKISITANYNYNLYNRDYTDDSASVGGFAKYQKGKYKSRSQFAEVYGNFKFNKNFGLLAGVDYRRLATGQSYLSISSFGPYESLPLSADTIHTKQFSSYASLNVKIGKGFNTELGTRWNHHSIYGNNFTYSFNPSYLKNKFKIFANISSGYRVPSLYQLYSEFGNKKLKPETSTNYEAGVQLLDEKITGRIVLFKRDIKNVFVFYTDPVSYASIYLNEDKQKDEGVETELFFHPSDKINISANYSYVEGKIFTKDFSGKDTSYHNLYRKPSQTLNITFGYQALKALFLSAHFKTVGKFYEAKYSDTPYPMKGYYTLDIYGEYKLKRMTLFTDLQNITDQQYFDIRGFNSKRFNFNTGINVNY